MAKLLCGWWVGVLLAGFLRAAEPAQPGGAALQIPFDGQADAPEFPDSLQWLNTGRPLTWKDLRGKVVLLDFWTYCCINCMHIIPDLKKLEAKYGRELVVIGVHSAKFSNEKETDNIREAIQRYEIEHPVINDRDFKVWRSFGIRAWPSLMLVNPQGRIIGGHSGEGIYELFDQVIDATVKHFDAKNQIDRRPIEWKLENASQPPALLAYPGKITADEKSRRLVFSDSNHNRIIVATLAGEILEVIGSGEAGLQDGTFTSAKFFRPQGVCFDAANELIYVADTENHAIRRIDLKARTVTTLAGTGRQARQHNVEGRGVELNSPWDLLLVDGKLFIAMAGPHQLWTLDLKTLEARVHAGSARENINDGPLKEANLAQPSGITTGGKKLFFADSEVSALRAADLDPAGKVETLIGEGLFEFGDVDGAYPKARLQHPLGVAFHEGAIYVADTYNHKIKKLDPATKQLTTLIGTGKRGLTDGPFASAQLNEPSGLCFADGRMFIADANNHVIRVADLKSETLATLEWKGMEKLAATKSPSPTKAGQVLLDPRKVSPETRVLEFKLTLPAGKKLNSAAASSVKLASSDRSVIELEQSQFALTNVVLSVPVRLKPGAGKITFDVDLFYCDRGNAGLCYFKEATLVLPVEVTAGQTGKLAANFVVPR